MCCGKARHSNAEAVTGPTPWSAVSTSPGCQNTNNSNHDISRLIYVLFSSTPSISNVYVYTANLDYRLKANWGHMTIYLLISSNRMQMEGSLQSLCEFYISLIRRIFTGLDSFGHIGTFCFKQVIGSPQWCWWKESFKQRLRANMESESFRTHCSVLCT